MNIIETERLIICQLTVEDKEFIFELLNTPSWLKFIGNKNINSIEDAENYILNVPMKSYEKFGFGLYMTKLKDDTPIGICGLIKRGVLEDVDLGFAFLPEYEGKGYAFEAASAVMTYAKSILGLEKIVAITNPDNIASIKLLKKIGFELKNTIKLSQDDNEIMLFSI